MVDWDSHSLWNYTLSASGGACFYADGFGLPFLFFLVQGVIVLLERKHSAMRYLCIVFLIVGLPVLFPSGFVQDIILPVEEVWREALYY